MNRFSILLALLMLAAGPLQAAGPDTPSAHPQGETRTPGVALAEGITKITGVAVSPLLGVSAIGCWTWLRTPEESRAGLAWYCQPWAWGSGLFILALCFMKDSLGAAAPGILKKPFDLAELLENQASALVASVGFVPLVAAEMARALQPVATPTAMIHGGMMAFIDPAWVVMPLAIAGFGVVWLCSHAINVLIILSPFSSIDTLLKLGRTGMLASVAISYAIAPWLGAALCLVILSIAIWLAPGALRLAIFGTRVAGDLVFPGRGRRRARPERPHAFTLNRLEGLPTRTGGWLASTADGGVTFCYRRFIIGPENRVKLPPGRHDLAKGLLMPVVVHVDGNSETKSLVLLPRYRGREEEIRQAMAFSAVRDHAWNRSRAAAKEWWRTITAKSSEG